MDINSILSQLKGLISESDGKLSNKRFITMLCAVMLAVGFYANVFMAKHIDDNMLNSIVFIIIGGMGITGMEKFAPKSLGGGQGQ